MEHCWRKQPYGNAHCLRHVLTLLLVAASETPRIANTQRPGEFGSYNDGYITCEHYSMTWATVDETTDLQRQGPISTKTLSCECGQIQTKGDNRVGYWTSADCKQELQAWLLRPPHSRMGREHQDAVHLAGDPYPNLPQCQRDRVRRSPASELLKSNPHRPAANCRALAHERRVRFHRMRRLLSWCH